MVEMLFYYANEHIEMFNTHMTLKETLDEETPSLRSHNRVRNRRFPQVYLPSLAIPIDIQSQRKMWGAGRHITESTFEAAQTSPSIATTKNVG